MFVDGTIEMTKVLNVIANVEFEHLDDILHQRGVSRVMSKIRNLIESLIASRIIVNDIPSILGGQRVAEDVELLLFDVIPARVLQESFVHGPVSVLLEGPAGALPDHLHSERLL